jgi:hypothetical protein
MIGWFFEWYFWEIPQKIKKIWGNYLWFFGRYFALADLWRELFLPWKGLTFKREKRSFELGDALSAAAGNFISIIIGAIARSFLLVFGLLVELLAVVAGIFVYCAWLVLIPVIFYFFWRGIELLF